MFGNDLYLVYDECPTLWCALELEFTHYCIYVGFAYLHTQKSKVWVINMWYDSKFLYTLYAFNCRYFKVSGFWTLQYHNNFKNQAYKHD